jgi:hypothetical protein
MVMYSGDENRQSCKYSKITDASAQNEHISCKKNGFLHYFFSPILFLTLLYITLQWGLLLLVVFRH